MKRLAKKNTVETTGETSSNSGGVGTSIATTKYDSKKELPYNLLISPYGQKSFLVTGDLIKHGGDLLSLRGVYKPHSDGYMFNYRRKQSVEKYIETGKIEIFEYTDEEKALYQQQNLIQKEKTPNDYTKHIERRFTKHQVEQIFNELKSLFETDGYYDYESIIEAIDMVHNKYNPSVRKIK